MNGHIKAISKPSMAILGGNNPIDVLVLKEFIVDTLSAVNELLGRKNATPPT